MNDKEISHFWVGQMPQRAAGEYFVETYADNRDETPLSAFARDQGKGWYDHDRLEAGWGTSPTIQELVAGYSYSNQWADELARRVAAAGLTGVNFFVFITEDQIDNPKSVDGDGYWLRYMGVIEYNI